MAVRLIENLGKYYGVYFENADGNSAIVYSKNFDAMATLDHELRNIDSNFIDGWDDIRYITKQVRTLCRDMFGSSIDIHWINDARDCGGFGEYTDFDSEFGENVTIDVIGYIIFDGS